MVIFKTLAEWRKALGLSPDHRHTFSSCDLHSIPAGLTLQTRAATRLLFYGVGIIRLDSLEYSIGNGQQETAGSHLLFLLSPFHVFRFRQMERLEGWCFFASEEWMHQYLEAEELQLFYEAGGVSSERRVLSHFFNWARGYRRNVKRNGPVRKRSSVTIFRFY